ncbi:MAG: hypothetical protein WCD82_16460, partial [Xanthobacteraceae bacterium]
KMTVKELPSHLAERTNEINHFGYQPSRTNNAYRMLHRAPKTNAAIIYQSEQFCTVVVAYPVHA